MVDYEGNAHIVEVLVAPTRVTQVLLARKPWIHPFACVYFRRRLRRLMAFLAEDPPLWTLIQFLRNSTQAGSLALYPSRQGLVT